MEFKSTEICHVLCNHANVQLLSVQNHLKKVNNLSSSFSETFLLIIQTKEGISGAIYVKCTLQ